MQSRRHEDFASQSSYARGRRNTDVGPDSYLMMAPHSKRSWSPRRTEGPSYSERVVGGGHRRSVSLERRRVADDGSRRIRSRSPPIMEGKRGGPFYNEDYVIDRDLPTDRRRRYEFLDHMKMDHDDFDSRTGSRVRNEFDYSHGSSRRAMVGDKYDGRRLDGGMPEMVSQKAPVTGQYRLTGDTRTTSITERGGERLGLSHHLGKERVQYPDIQGSYSFDKYSSMKEGEKDIVHLRDAPYSNLTASRSKDSLAVSHFEDYARTSPQKSRVDHLGYRGDIPLPGDDYPLKSANMREPLSHSRYGQRQHLDPDLDINEDMARYPRTGHHDSLRHQPRIQERDDYLYPAEDVYEKMNPRRDMLTPNLLDPVTQRVEASDFAIGNMSSRGSWDHHSLENLPANNIGLKRSPSAQREGGQYLDPVSVHSRLGRKISREQEMPYMGTVQDREIARKRVDYDFKREVGVGSHKERMRSPPGLLYDSERLRFPERTHKMEGHDLSPYDSSSRFSKRKYTMDDEENRISSRTMVGGTDTLSRRHNRDFRDEEWVDQDARGSSFTKRREISRRADKSYDGTDPISEEWFSSHDSEEVMRDHPMKSYKYDDKYTKGYSRSNARSGYNSYHPNKRHVHPKWKKTWTRSENEDDDDMLYRDIEPYEDWANDANPEPPEDTEEFKQLMHEFFLSFTKKLNETLGVRRRYMDHGRAGSLFCIVCGRSASKEFLDAQRLATHAFMSHKTGLRAQHLALHKAICVMLGWNNTIHPGTIMWYPRSLSSSESLAQKHDLIIWPPVIIIHNTSISNHDPNPQGPTTEEALGQFLRSKGLSSGKVRLGKPSNGSIMLVKFLATFSGLKDAEKIHKYFAKNKHGRTDLEQIASSKGKNKGIEGENKNEDKDMLFGYMGIAEDLDRLDFDSKRKCSIKSKKEIQDLADAPVKPE